MKRKNWYNAKGDDTKKPAYRDFHVQSELLCQPCIYQANGKTTVLTTQP